MEKMKLHPGDVVQLKPDHVHYPEHLVVVTEAKSFGCQGYLLSWGPFEAVTFKGKAYVRISWDQMEYVGKLSYFDSSEHEDE
jgi:hypothetical protein